MLKRPLEHMVQAPAERKIHRHGPFHSHPISLTETPGIAAGFQQLRACSPRKWRGRGAVLSEPHHNELGIMADIIACECIRATSRLDKVFSTKCGVH